jgi:hypothetical protein
MSSLYEIPEDEGVLLPDTHWFVMLIFRAAWPKPGHTDPAGLLVPSSVDHPFPGRLKTMDDEVARERGQRAKTLVNEYAVPEMRKSFTGYDPSDRELWGHVLYHLVVSLSRPSTTRLLTLVRPLDELFAEWVAR